MDIRGGTLNYEGLSVLNDVEAAAFTGTKKRQRGRLIPTPACLQRVACVLENEGETLCPFSILNTDFCEGIEFEYAKTTRLVINAFGLEALGKQRSINISSSIDAAKLTKNLTHTSSGLKMSDVMDRLLLLMITVCVICNLGTQFFLMKIVLTKETKESVRLFDDIFQFFDSQVCRMKSASLTHTN